MDGYKYHVGFNDGWAGQLSGLYRVAGLGEKDVDQLRVAMQQSFAVVTCWQRGTLCGAGRVISDGVFYAAVHDVAVLPAHQRRGIGREIMNRLEAAVCGTRIYLTATFGSEGFYQRLGYKRHKTAMAKYPGPLSWSPYLEHDQGK